MQCLVSTVQRAEVDAFVAVTRDLVGVALRSIAPEGVTVTQFRVLLVLHDQGQSPSAQVARMLGVVPSSVTRLASRLVTAGLVERSPVPQHRGVVALSLQPAGTRLVLRVMQRRVDELTAVLACLPAQARASAAETLRDVHDLLGKNEAIGPML